MSRSLVKVATLGRGKAENFFFSYIEREKKELLKNRLTTLTNLDQ